jgi:hypothetical protein
MQGNTDLFRNTYGKTPLEQKEVMREPLRDDLIQQRIQGQLIQDVTITPKEVVAYFESIPARSLSRLLLPKKTKKLLELNCKKLKIVLSMMARTSPNWPLYFLMILDQHRKAAT